MLTGLNILSKSVFFKVPESPSSFSLVRSLQKTSPSVTIRGFYHWPAALGISQSETLPRQILPFLRPTRWGIKDSLGMAWEPFCSHRWERPAFLIDCKTFLKFILHLVNFNSPMHFLIKIFQLYSSMIYRPRISLIINPRFTAFSKSIGLQPSAHNRFRTFSSQSSFRLRCSSVGREPARCAGGSNFHI